MSRLLQSRLKGKRFVALLLALTTLLALAGPVARAEAADGPTSASKLPTYGDKDDFVAGAINPNKTPTLTVTSYLSSDEGFASTGSANDQNEAAEGRQANSGADFELSEVQPAAGLQWSQVSVSDVNTFVKVGEGHIYYGSTGADGSINPDQWFMDNDHKTPSAGFPKGEHHYLLHQTGSRYSSRAFVEDSIFGLPYRTTQTDTNGVTSVGYIYNLHLFPKNQTTNQLSKVMTHTSGSAIAQVGDKQDYEITQVIANDSNPQTSKDSSLLQLSNIADTNIAEDGTGVQLRVVDRLPASLKTVADPTVSVTFTGDNGRQVTHDVPAAVYSYSTGHSAPKRINPTYAGQSMTTQDGREVGTDDANTTYLTFDFFKDVATFKTLIAGAQKDHRILLRIDLKTQVTANGDSISVDAGHMGNIAFADHGYTPKPLAGASHTPTAGFQFVKTDIDGNGLPGAVFRLSDPDSDARFLASDGKFYADGDQRPSGVDFIQAASNNAGIVSFVDLPVMQKTNPADPTTWKGVGLKVNIEEYSAPVGYARAREVFKQLDFSAIEGKSEEDIVTSNPEGIFPAGYEPSNTKPSTLFGAYGVTPKDAKDVFGKPITVGMKNWKATDILGRPMGLPLTGGMGIVIFLVLGALVMALAAWRRHRAALKAEQTTAR
ncbi:hypothetical protein [Bifidobacterium sp. ESL0800]|uniref:hypothetical protein n=1 Tax=Bifidobacterium sp. ESL0800 TaxID=2983236 RepID=UPI0023F957BF|nr:hypothetical protein [Bifidobacterium sp. ESL0800]WEV75453.1 hypothetical protein OZX75_07485 [Bifidobacterium sp. ESL0800]